LNTVKSTEVPMWNVSRRKSWAPSDHAVYFTINRAGSRIEVIELTRINSRTRFLCETSDASHLTNDSTQSRVDPIRLVRIMTEKAIVLILMKAGKGCMVCSEKLSQTSPSMNAASRWKSFRSR